MDNCLALCAHFHKDPEKEYKGSFNIRLPKELHHRLVLEAAKPNKEAHNARPMGIA